MSASEESTCLASWAGILFGGCLILLHFRLFAVAMACIIVGLALFVCAVIVGLNGDPPEQPPAAPFFWIDTGIEAKPARQSQKMRGPNRKSRKRF